MAAAQRDSDISKVCQVLELQSLMDNLSEDVRADFLSGTNGAVVSWIQSSGQLWFFKRESISLLYFT